MQLNKLINTRYGQMLINSNDTIIGRYLDLYGEWYQAELDLLKDYIQPGFYCLDIGANVGTHTLFFANIVGKEGRIYSFEPQRVIFQLLSANIALNDYLNVWTNY